MSLFFGSTGSFIFCSSWVSCWPLRRFSKSLYSSHNPLNALHSQEPELWKVKFSPSRLQAFRASEDKSEMLWMQHWEGADGEQKQTYFHNHSCDYLFQPKAKGNNVCACVCVHLSAVLANFTINQKTNLNETVDHWSTFVVNWS